MTRRELNVAIFEGRADVVLWQPYLDTWINHHAERGTLPGRLRGMDTLAIYDALGCSPRYAAGAGLTRREEPADVVRTEEVQGNRVIRSITTPGGTIRAVHRRIIEGGRVVNSRIERYPVATPQDMRVLIDLVEREQYGADVEAFRAAEQKAGDRSEPTVSLSSAGFTDLVKWWCGLENTFYLLADHPDVVDAYVEACERRDDRQLEAALQLPCRIYHFPDHATSEFTPPPILKKYMLPRWQRLSARLHAAGRFIHSHWDGNARVILPYLRDSGLDSIEALTPRPQGDMTLEQIKDAVGDRMVVLDLLPAIHFLPHFSMREMLDFARRVIDMFAPRLILGISDEISEVGEIEKVEAVTELVAGL